jgi:hypothetical protein
MVQAGELVLGYPDEHGRAPIPYLAGYRTVPSRYSGG